MTRVGLRLLLALLLAASAQVQFAAAQASGQLSFRAVLLKYDERADAETDIAALRRLEVERAGELARILGPGLKMDGWQLILSAAEATPLGGIFIRLHDPALNATRSVRPTYWNSGPGDIHRQAEITVRSPLHGPIVQLKRGTLVVVSGNFFADDNGGPAYESTKTAQLLSVERARFRMPFFSIRLEGIDELFPERRFP